MAEIAWTLVPANINGQVWRATPVATGDTTAALTINEGNSDVSVHIYGTIGGATAVVQGTLASTTFSTIDDAYGTAMSYTTLPAIKPVGPGVTALKGAVSAGAGSMTFDVYIIQKAR